MAVTGRGEAWWRQELILEGWNTIREMLRYPDPDVQEIAEKADRQQVAVIRTGRRRGYCRYTEAANFGFQGLAADVSKEAMWLAESRGLEMKLFCHDELVVQCRPEHAEAVKDQLEGCMFEAFERVCPDVGKYAGVESEIADRWGKTTDISGEVLKVE
jgi:DNA polymerase I-like protein with 3'-5' exonuclease and polymerase domains